MSLLVQSVRVNDMENDDWIMIAVTELSKESTVWR